MSTTTNNFHAMSWIIGLLFVLIGLMNIVFIHVIPGLVYLLISLLYFPIVDDFLKTTMGVSIPVWSKIILAVLVIWFTLGVSDLVELMESKWL